VSQACAACCRISHLQCLVAHSTKRRMCHVVKLPHNEHTATLQHHDTKADTAHSMSLACSKMMLARLEPDACMQCKQLMAAMQTLPCMTSNAQLHANVLQWPWTSTFTLVREHFFLSVSEFNLLRIGGVKGGAPVKGGASEKYSPFLRCCQ
jgi:hypothetical protein